MPDIRETDDALRADIAAVARIGAVPTILDVVCRTTGMGFAAVARVTADRWVALGVRDLIGFGLTPGGELEVDTTICHEIRRNPEPVVISDVAEDVVYCRHPTPARYGFRSYISMPIVLADGSFFGTLCAIDPKPAKLDAPGIVDMFRLFAELIATHLMNIRRVALAEANLADERRIAADREKFIAVLGHDLRNPLASVKAGMELLRRTPLDDKATRVVGMVETSVGRMGSLIEDVLDFARGRLGGGLPMLRGEAYLTPVLAQIVAEMRTAWPDRRFETNFVLPVPVDCDRRRIGQLFSNLLANALTHGRQDTPVRAEAICNGGVFELSVANTGEPISAAMRERLFEPFARGAESAGRPAMVEEKQTHSEFHDQGLGLGLYICAEIAKAHGGCLDVASDGNSTRFTFRMPLT
jgi:signal transduction histidine kinase